MAVMTPEVDPIVATEVLLLLQVPPGVASLIVSVLPRHIRKTEPAEIGAGCTFTVTTVVA